MLFYERNGLNVPQSARNKTIHINTPDGCDGKVWFREALVYVCVCGERGKEASERMGGTRADTIVNQLACIVNKSPFYNSTESFRTTSVRNLLTVSRPFLDAPYD